jgi:hypothetical protein
VRTCETNTSSRCWTLDLDDELAFDDQVEPELADDLVSIDHRGRDLSQKLQPAMSQFHAHCAIVDVLE